MSINERKQRDFERREQEILDAALGLLSRPNWEMVTIDQIAQAAEIGKGTVYKHFVSKDELLFRLMMRFYRGLLHDFELEFRLDSAVLESFREIFKYALNYHLQNREYRYIVEYCKCIDFKERADTAWHDSFQELDRGFSAWGDPMIESAMQQGLIEKRPMIILQTGMHACFNGAVAMLWAGRDWCQHGSEPEVVENVTDFMMAGLIGRVQG